MSLEVARRVHFVDVIRALVFIASFILVLTSIYLFMPNAKADSISWTSLNNPTFSVDSLQNPSSNPSDDCVRTARYLYNGPNSTPLNDNIAQVCLVEKGSWRHATYSYVTPSTHTIGTGFAVGFGSDARLYRVDDFPIDLIHTLPNSDDILRAPFQHEANYDFPKPLVIYTDAIDRLTFEHIENRVDHYTFNSQGSFILKRPNGTVINVPVAAVSENGDWIVAYSLDIGLIRINRSTQEVKRFSNLNLPTRPTPTAYLAISNDGSHVVLTGQPVDFRIYDISDGCGDAITDTMTHDTLIANPCAEKDLRTYVASEFSSRFGSYSFSAFPSFSADGGEIGFQGLGSVAKMITLSAPGYTAPRLDYLALGDSYSSGEGDTAVDQNGEKHYRPFTDKEEQPLLNQPREKCHLSTRSYPYLLATDMTLGITNSQAATGQGKWNSVACSGAVTDDIQRFRKDGGYKGQGKGAPTLWDNGSIPRLEGYDVSALQTRALNEFIPGRIEQIHFLEKYRPKAATITIGGNDIDFGGKIVSCLMPDTCYIATPEGRPVFGGEIMGLFGHLVHYFERLKQASPSTKIYVVGYPDVISGESSCLFNAGIGGINPEERHAISQGYRYANTIISEAAERSGVVYLNVGQAFLGHRLCDATQDSYVTGVTWSANNNHNERQESFHPNAKGHNAIAQTIMSSLGSASLIDYEYSQQPNISLGPSQPEGYLAFSSTQAITKSEEMASSSIQKSTSAQISLGSYSTQPNSLFTATLHSNPTDLGTISSNQDGSVSAQIVIPSSVTSGYHTLIIEGHTYSGEPIKYQQVVFVYSNKDDLDEDGVLDTIDPCLFIMPSNQDQDLDGQDDACDPEVGTPRPVYKLRTGDTSRTFNAAPELSTNLYLERNIFAKVITGIEGDYDPDHDHYATIAVMTPPAKLARYQEDKNTIPNTISLSFRTSENGCVRYTPDLTKVTQANQTTRAFTQVATDTNTCREQSPTADLDNNGQPDNTQPLYRARNGDLTKGENPKKLYLERSTRAAESQLNKSDYAPNKPTAPTTISPTDTTDYRADWSLIASTQSAPVTPLTYKKVHMAGTQPYVLARVGILGLCQAYKPQNLGTIKQSVQNGTNLTLNLAETLQVQLHGGCN